MRQFTEQEEKVWRIFAEQEGVSPGQLKQFQAYEALLSEWNKAINLTAVYGVSNIVARHFVDSLAVRKFFDLSKIKLVADIGSGAGFPGIPLKIMFPHLGVILIEVTKKKQNFLQMVINELGLEGIEVCGLDWRTFLRKTESPIEYFLTRASLDPLELLRMFRPACPYKNAKLVYWASEEWLATRSFMRRVVPRLKKFVKKEHEYVIKRKKRKLVLMGL